MKKATLLIAVFGLSFSMFAQPVEITADDIAEAGQGFPVIEAEVPFSLNLEATGPEFSWNFSDLVTEDQAVDTFWNPTSTNIAYLK